jgi:hypothetical protein
MSKLFIKLSETSMTYLKEYLGDSLFELPIYGTESIYLSHSFRQEGSRVVCLIYKTYVAVFCKSILNNDVILTADPVCFTVVTSENVGGLPGKYHMMPRFQSKEYYNKTNLIKLLLHELEHVFRIRVNNTCIDGLFTASNFDNPNYMGDTNHFLSEYHEDVY